MSRKIFLIVGSMKGQKSTSAFIANRLIGMLKKQDFIVDTMYLDAKINLKQEELLLGVNNADIIILSSPLYIDGPPYLVNRAMELVADYRNNNKKSERKDFLVITNGGYPEATYNSNVLSIYNIFAEEANFKWLGGLYMGEGAVFSVPALRTAGYALNIFSHIEKGLRQASFALLNNNPISVETIELVAKPYVPFWLYSFLARSVAKLLSLKNKSGSIYYKPY